MAVFTCNKCGIVLMEKVEDGTKIPCPACGKAMIPKAGTGAPDIGFPQKPLTETVLDLDVPENIRALDEKRRRETKRHKKP